MPEQPFRIVELWDRLSQYEPWGVALELGLIASVLYIVLRFVKGTRAAGALWAFLLILAAGGVASRLVQSPRLDYLYDRFLALAAVALVVIFQPELRRALIRIGETNLFRATPGAVQEMIDEIVPACAYLAKARFGALIVVQRQSDLKGAVEGGTTLGAELSGRLLQTIFFPGSALHDLAVVVRGQRIEAAGVQLPLAEPQDMPDPTLGSRHRAAVGLTKETDALVVVVSEETGAIRVAEAGRLSRPLSAEDLEAELKRRIGRGPGSSGGVDEASGGSGGVGS